MAGRAGERALWGVIYAVSVLAPVAFLLAAPETEDSDDLFAPVAIGFTALTVLALQVVLASRGRSFTTAFGIDRIIRIHRIAGILVLALVVAHVATVVLSEDDYGFWLNPVEAPLAGKLGQAAVLLLVLLAVTMAWRRGLRIRYETWRGLHAVFALGAIGLAFGHVIAVSRFTATGVIRWVTLGFVVLALLAAFHLRVTRPFLAARRPFRLAGSRREPDGSITLELEAVGHAGAPFRPGQFAWLKHAGAPYALTEHPFSYASSALDPARPSFTVRAVGDFTRALGQLPGDARLLIDGPHGAPALVDERDTVLLAGGSGITPSMSVLRTAALEDDPRRLTLLYFLRDPARPAFAGELAELARRPQVRVELIGSRDRGRVSAALLDELLPADRRRWSYFVCGPPGQADAAETGLRELGIPRAAIRVERFAFA